MTALIIFAALVGWLITGSAVVVWIGSAIARADREQEAERKAAAQRHPSTRLGPRQEWLA